ncbi:MAG: hypothetical protein CFE45_23865 [Burkholderiales bacterium PBB5]|nr:MAG: hypothetical protein CFE45_23865 [Burkholderiales bacterium PBB5]
MLGLVFTEFVELVEDKFSPEVADAVLQDVAAPHGGAYTAVGYYPHGEMVAMVGALSARTGVLASDLLKTFGGHLLERFTQAHGGMFARHATLFDLLSAIDGEIHVEVRKLYAQAALPRFAVLSRDERCLGLLYQSPRRMEDLALGLMAAAARHYGEPCRISHSTYSGPEGDGTLFTGEKVAG